MHPGRDLALSFVFAAVGAILRWAIQIHLELIDVRALSIVVFVAGSGGVVVSLFSGMAGHRHATASVDWTAAYLDYPPHHGWTEVNAALERETVGGSAQSGG